MPYKTVRMIRDLEAARGGGSQSRIIENEAGKRYLAKFKENPQGLRVLVNELLVNKIAQMLEVPCPEGVIVQVEDKLLQVSPIHLNGRQVSPGKHYGMEFVGGVIDPSSGSIQSMLNLASNLEAIPALVVLDIYTLNTDRNLSGNMLVVKPEEDPSKVLFYAIDHGHCFGSPAWNNGLAARSGEWYQNLCPELIQHIKGGNPFGPVLNRLKNISDKQIDEAVDDLPIEEWGLNNGEPGVLKNFLKQRRDQMENLLIANKAVFPYWR